MKPAIDIAVYVVVRSLILFVSTLPRPLAYFFCETVAGLVYRFDLRHRHIGMVNLRLAFPDRDDQWRAAILQQSFRQLGTHAVELFKMFRLSPGGIRARIPYEEGFGAEHYQRARREAGPVLFVTAHIGAWEVLPSAHAAHTHPLHFLVRPLDNPYLDEWVTRQRSRFGNSVLSKHGSLRRVIATLREGHDVGFLIDQNVQEKEGVYVEFLGHPACTASGVAALAARTGARVVCGFILPTEKKGHYRIRFYPSIAAEGDLIADTQKFVATIEAVIREYPHCWLWGHRRFNTQPDGKDLYE